LGTDVIIVPQVFVEGQHVGVSTCNVWYKLYIHVTSHPNKFLFKQPTRRTNYPNYILL
jgi:hypothetical protein